MEIFIVGTIWFWILVAVASVFIIISLENNWGGTGATLTFLAAFMALVVFGGKEDLKALGGFLFQSPKQSILYILAYFGIGVVWSFVKWYFFLLNWRDKLLKQESVDAYDIPKAKHEYGRIISWMSYWMFSMAWTIVNDPVKRTFKFLFARLEGVYQKIADKMFADIKAGIDKNK